MSKDLPRGIIGKWTRKYAGCYTATACVVMGDQRRHVEFQVRSMPEWRGPDKWAVEAHAAIDASPYPDDHPVRLVEVSDSPHRTKDEAIKAAEELANSTFRLFPQLGWCVVAS